MTVAGEPADLVPTDVTFRILAVEDGTNFSPEERVGDGPVTLGFWMPDQVRLEVPPYEQGKVTHSLIWGAFCDFVRPHNLDLREISHRPEAAVCNLPDTPIVVETSGGWYEMPPVRLVAAGLRLAHAFHARGNP